LRAAERRIAALDRFVALRLARTGESGGIDAARHVDSATGLKANHGATIPLPVIPKHWT